jgi:hypothetical protein
LDDAVRADTDASFTRRCRDKKRNTPAVMPGFFL